MIKHAVHIEKRVAKIRDADEREDLQMVAKSYHAHLMVQKSQWVTEEEMGPPGTIGGGSKPKSKAGGSDSSKVNTSLASLFVAHVNVPLVLQC